MGSAQGTPTKYGKFDFIREDNGDKAMNPSACQSKRTYLGEII